MKKNILYLFILLVNNMFSQITLKLIDSVRNKPASYIMVLNDKDEIITSSNELGIVILNDKTKLSDKLIFESIFFERKEMELKKIQDNSIIILRPKITALDEVVVTSNSKKYLVISAYYRIYNIVDSVLVSFVDAEVKYIKKKNSFKKKVLNFRIFDNYPKDKYKEGSPYWVVNLKTKTLIEQTNKKYYLKKHGENSIDVVDKKDNQIIGKIKTKSDSLQEGHIFLSINEREGNYEIKYTEEYENNNLITTNIKDLIYKSKTSVVKITPKMIKLTPSLKNKKVEIHKVEFFIQDIDHITKKEYKKIIKKGYKDTSVSHYKQKFWKNLENVKPLDSYLQKQLNTTVIERKAE